MGQLEQTRSDLVIRSVVTAGKPYSDYKTELRVDFFYSCAYCTMSEAEARAIRFTIDHYEPSSARPDLKDSYSNLMYCCDQCNMLKSDIYPPISARSEGKRFFNAEIDSYSHHFVLNGIRIEPLTSVGHFNIEILELNRRALQKIRDLRQRMEGCHKLVAAGVRALQTYPIDHLPPRFRAHALSIINRAANMADEKEISVDEILTAYAKSDLIDFDPEAAVRARDRAEALAGWKVMHPGKWRGRGKKSA